MNTWSISNCRVCVC